MDLLLQYTENQLSGVYSTLVKAIAAAISTEDSSVAALNSLSSSTTTSLTTASGCARDDGGNLMVQFYASAANITREIDGLLASRRRLQSTPCSTTDGTSVCSYHTPSTVALCRTLLHEYEHSWPPVVLTLLHCAFAAIHSAAAAWNILGAFNAATVCCNSGSWGCLPNEQLYSCTML